MLSFVCWKWGIEDYRPTLGWTQRAIFRPTEAIDDIYLRLRLYQRW